jgi:hypothetical protein
MEQRQMTDNPNISMTGVDLSTAIDLRWTLRDIRAKRTKSTPLNSDHVRTLIEMGLVELRDDQPVLTNAGLDAITRLIGSLGQQLKGEVRLAYEPTGFVYTMDVPMTSLVAPA